MVNPTSKMHKNKNLQIDRHDGLNGLHSGSLGDTGKPGKLMGDDPEAAANFGFNNLSDPTEARWGDGIGWDWWILVTSVSLQCIQVII